MTKKTNEVALATKNVADALIPNLFNDIDMSTLNDAITRMGDASGELSDKEKDTAVEIIEEWNDSVVGRLRAKENEMREISNFLSLGSSSEYVDGVHYVSFGEDLAKSTKTDKTFAKLLAFNEELEDLTEDRPIRAISTENTTFMEDVQYQKDYEALRAVHNIKEDAVRREIAKTLRLWKREMSKTDTVKDIINSSKRFMSGVGKLKENAKDKSQMAKLNISISSETARQTIRELLDFTETI